MNNLTAAEWKRIRQRYADFWNHRLTGRAILKMSSSLPGKSTAELLPVRDLHDKWENADLILHNSLCWQERTRHFAESYPNIFSNMGPGFLAAMIGGSYQLAEDTVWFANEPIIEDYARDLEKVRMYTESDAYKLIYRMMETYAKGSEGRYITTMTDLGGTLDIAASLRGNEEILFDIYDEPDGLLELIDRIDVLWSEAYQTLYDLLQKYQTGVDSWHGIYCEKRYYPLQCDACAMLSPAQFDKFVLPSLQRQCDFLDYGDYHLDGPDCVRHLDSLLSIPNLDAIQWVPGDGAPGYADPIWMPMYHRIQDAGKNLILLGLSPDEARKMLSELDQTKLMINVYCPDAQTCEEILTFAETHA